MTDSIDLSLRLINSCAGEYPIFKGVVLYSSSPRLISFPSALLLSKILLVIVLFSPLNHWAVDTLDGK